MVGKFANLAGQWQYRKDRSAGRLTRSIEYKDHDHKLSVASSQNV